MSQPGRLIDVRTYGVIGNGVADDTAAMRRALNTVSTAIGTLSIPAGVNVRVTNHLWMHGRTYLVGPGTITLDGNPTYGKYWINAGAKFYGATAANRGLSVWTGSIRDVTFRTTANVTT